MFCSSCGVKNDEGAKFCGGCGKPMGDTGSQSGSGSSQSGSSQSSAAQSNKCPACRAPIESSQTRCPSCGTELNKSSGSGSSQSSAPAAQPNKCPACRAPIESFQTRCSSCGAELNTAQSGESVKSFFAKLDDLTQKEYEANKTRDSGGKKAKSKQPKIVVLCEVVAVISIILLILQLTPLPGMLRGIGAEGTFSYDTGARYVEFNISNDSRFDNDEIIIVSILDGNSSPIEESITLLERTRMVTLSDDANTYLVFVIDGVDKGYFYPENENPVRMSGVINLSFDGNKLVRY